MVERRVFTVTGERPTEEQVETMIESGESEAIFQKAILEQGRGQVLDTVAEIQERHEAVREMEKGLLELHSVFMDMAVLVEAQGEMLDNIATQVSKSVDYVKKGTVALSQAKEYQKKSRKWMCYAIICLLMIIVVSVVAVLKPWETGDARRMRALQGFAAAPTEGALLDGVVRQALWRPSAGVAVSQV